MKHGVGRCRVQLVGSARVRHLTLRTAWARRCAKVEIFTRFVTLFRNIMIMLFAGSRDVKQVSRKTQRATARGPRNSISVHRSPSPVHFGIIRISPDGAPASATVSLRRPRDVTRHDLE